MVLLLLLAACARAPQTVRLALLASFEGRYREIGYNALYAARLALADSGMMNIELLPIDDGGTAATAVERARALAGDPQVIGAVVLGFTSANVDTLTAFGDVPVIVVGNWGAEPISDNIFILSSSQIPAQLTADIPLSITGAARLDAPLAGGDIFALEQFPELRPDLSGITVISSGLLPDADFATRYKGSDPFAPEPGLLATLIYDAFRLLAADTLTRPALRDRLAAGEYTGFNGLIRFEDGWWANAPIHRYFYNTDAQLQPES